MFCSKCGAGVDDKSQFCVKCGAPVSGTRESSEPTTVKESVTQDTVPKKKSKRKLWVWLAIGLAAIRLVVSIGKSGEDTSKNGEKQVKSVPLAVTAENDKPKAEELKTTSNITTSNQQVEDLKTAIENAKRALSWIKTKGGMTELQREAGLKKMKDMQVVFKGEVREVGKKVFGGTFVSLKVDRLNEFEDINVEFIVSGSVKEEVSNWSVGETHILSGQVFGGGDLVDDLTCKNGRIVSDAEFQATSNVTTDNPQVTDVKMKTAVTAVNDKPKAEELKTTSNITTSNQQVEDLKAAIENAKRALSWIKTKEDMTELQQEAGLKRMKDMQVVFKGEVREVGNKVFGGTFVSLKVDRLNEFEDINVEFIVSDLVKEEVSNWSIGETHILSGQVLGDGDLVDDLTCKNGRIVTEEEYRKNL